MLRLAFVPDDPEVSVVMPCLNEAKTLRTCIEKARRSLEGGDAGQALELASQAQELYRTRTGQSLRWLSAWVVGQAVSLPT